MILGARGARQRSILALADQMLSSLTNFGVSYLLAKLKHGHAVRRRLCHRPNALCVHDWPRPGMGRVAAPPPLE
jgi:hypothetical protein